MNNPRSSKRHPRQPSGPVKRHRHVRRLDSPLEIPTFISNNPLAELAYVCDQLNGASDPSVAVKTKYEQMEKEGWKLAEQVLNPICSRPLEKCANRDFRESLDLFYCHFWNYRNVKLEIDVQSRVPQCDVFPQAGSPRHFIAWNLWRIFKMKGYDRLRKCFQCNKWFVDRSDNKKARCCSNKCHDRHWNRERRREARHRSQVQGIKRKGQNNG